MDYLLVKKSLFLLALHYTEEDDQFYSFLMEYVEEEDDQVNAIIGLYTYGIYTLTHQSMMPYAESS